jgi:bifunctional non-homologous end joining protein LigD
MLKRAAKRSAVPLRRTSDAGTKRARNAGADRLVVTHPERIVFAGLGATKGDVADYYRQVAPWLLAQVRDRPLSLLRCPDGAGAACFFQKHAGARLGAHVRSVRLRDSSGLQQYLCIDDAPGLLELVQMNTLEFHAWGARARTTTRADRIVFDLDPHADVAWPDIAAAALIVRDHLATLGLAAFLRTSGGKGLHVVVPLRPAVPWLRVRRFARAVADALAAVHPARFVATAGEEKRVGRIFIDWLRNSRGATSVASYSLRARADAGVAMPLAWNRLVRLPGAHAFTLANAAAHVAARRVDPWRDIDSIEQALPRV